MQPKLLTRINRIWQLAANSLSGRLLLLTILFVLFSELLFIVPAVGRYYRNQLEQHILAAELAVYPFKTVAGQGLPMELRQQLLRHTNAIAISLKHADRRELYLGRDRDGGSAYMPGRRDRIVDMAQDSPLRNIFNGFECLNSNGRRVLFLTSRTWIPEAEEIDVVLNEDSIYASLERHFRQMLVNGLVIALISSLLVFTSLYFVLVRPMRRITQSMEAFRNDPEDGRQILEPSTTGGEIGNAERELAAMQTDLYGMLQQKSRLAAVGAAVARIQHDLRNILATAQLASERLSRSEDPIVKQLAPALIASIGHAVGLASRTLQYGRSEEGPPRRRRIELAELASEAFDCADASGKVRLVNTITSNMEIYADREQLFRAMLNLFHNAVTALAEAADPTISVSAQKCEKNIEIDISDNGPGIPEGIREKLFRPFALTSRRGGSGLGLTIARELIRGHGGDVHLMTTGPQGTFFRITLPSATV